MIWIIIAAAVAVLFIYALRGLAAQKARAKASYTKAGPLFTPAERSFLGVLDQVNGDRLRIFGKVRLADIITPQKGLTRSAWHSAFRRISAKHIDFLLCRADDLEPVCAIELDDASHENKQRRERDAFLNQAFEKAGLPLLRVPAQRTYKLGDIRTLLAPYLTDQTEEQPSDNATPAPLEKLCPKCGSPLKIRTARKGQHAGKQFWACSSYPRCRHIEPLAAENADVA